MTPEGKVKARVKKVLTRYGDELDAFWPVQNGMGSPALDCIVCYRGYHIEIETKAPGKLPTPRQLITIAKKEKAGARVFVIDGEQGCVELEFYLMWVKTFVPIISCDGRVTPTTYVKNTTTGQQLPSCDGEPARARY